MFPPHSFLLFAMKLVLLLTSLLQVSSVVVSQSLIEVSGYVGENVTLPSGADASWELSRIEWSIFSNNTWIATYFSKTPNTERFPDYKGRLFLDIATGNLTITNLRKKDTREYTVDLSNNQDNAGKKIKLTVKQRLQAPIIHEVKKSTNNGSCFMLLNCSSPDEGVNFSWHVNPPTLVAWNNSKSGLSQLIMNSNTMEAFEFTCVSSKGTENVPRVFKSKCDVEMNPTPERNRCVLIFLVGFLLGLIPSCLYCCCADSFKAVWQSLKERALPK